MTLSMGDAGQRCDLPGCHRIPVYETRGLRFCYEHARELGPVFAKLGDEQPR